MSLKPSDQIVSPFWNEPLIQKCQFNLHNNTVKYQIKHVLKTISIDSLHRLRVLCHVEMDPEQKMRTN